MIVRHRCDNPPCININHLALGTQKDNVRDSIERGRFVQNSRPLAGDPNEVIALHKEGCSYREIARRLHINVSAVARYVRRHKQIDN